MMNRKWNLNTTIITAAVFMMIGLMAGCSSDDSGLMTTSQTGRDDYEHMDLDQAYGGLTATDEEEAFGDEALKTLMLAEDQETVDDPLRDDPVVREMEERSRNMNQYEEGERPRFTYLRLRWGMLRGPDDGPSAESPCDVTDWTGTIRTDRGLVVVKRMIKFESPGDNVIFPRLNPQTVAFVSRTRCHFDGLLIQIIEPPIDSGTGPEVANKLYIDTEPFQKEFLVSELTGMEEVFEVDDLGNRFYLNGFGLSDIETCPKGFMSGRYRHIVDEDPGTAAIEGEGKHYGSFSGAWYKLNGRIHGFMRGGYGVNADGEKIFVGKVIDRRGRFRGLLRGGWEPVSDERGLGEFRGEWVTPKGRAEGLLGGRAHPVEGYPGGFYEGRWTTLCDDEAEGLVR
jgi:hypothetical protein